LFVGPRHAGEILSRRDQRTFSPGGIDHPLPWLRIGAPVFYDHRKVLGVFAADTEGHLSNMGSTRPCVQSAFPSTSKLDSARFKPDEFVNRRRRSQSARLRQRAVSPHPHTANQQSLRARLAWLIEPFRKPCLSFLRSPPADLWLKATPHDQVFAAIGSTAQPGRNPSREATEIERPVLDLVDAIIPVVGSSMPAVA
jgi:hypothetical protein